MADARLSPMADAAGPSEPTQRFWLPHRIGLLALGLALVVLAAWLMNWTWLPRYTGRIVEGLGVTLALLAVTSALGFVFAIGLGLAQAAGPFVLAWPARIFCTVIRGTPLLLQLWLIYYGLGSLFPQFPEIRQSALWPYLREAWPYAVTALTFSFAGYAGEVMRGALAGVPRGELEAARAYGMSGVTMLRRIWLPRAIQRALPTLTGETVLQLKATPLVATIPVIDVFAVFTRVRQDTFIIYEPLLLLAAIYLCLTFILVTLLGFVERRVPQRGA